MRILWLTAAFWLLLGIQAAQATVVSNKAASLSLPETVLTEAASAARTLNFEGVLVYRRDGAMEALRVVHRYRDGRVSEHLLTLTGDRRELVQQGNRLVCIFPRNRRLIFVRSPIKGFFFHLDAQAIRRLGHWYRFRALGTTRVAGRKVTGVGVDPRDAYRYGYQVWADVTHHLPLRVVLDGEGRTVLEQVMFTQIRFPSRIPDSAFRPQINRSSKYRVYTRHLPSGQSPTLSASDSRAAITDSRWGFGSLPPGFRVVLRDQRVMPDGVGHVQHILLSDGLATVSVFAAHMRAPGPDFQGISQIGPVHVFGRKVGDFHVTVVGEAPVRTVEMIGDSIHLDSGTSPGKSAPGTSAPPPGPATPSDYQ